MQAALDLQDGFSILLANGHGYNEILSWTWEQISFAVQGVLEVEHDRLDTLVRTLAPLMGAKLKDTTTAREARHRAVLEDQRARRAQNDLAVKRSMEEQAMEAILGMGFEIETTGPVKPGKGKR